MAKAIIRTVVANAITSGGPTQDFTVSGIGTPKAAMVIITRNDGAYGIDPQKKLCIGFTDGTFEGGVAAQSQHNVGTTECNSIRYDDAIVRLPSNDGTTDVAVGAFDSFITDGIRIDWTTIPNLDYKVFVVLFAGDDLSASAGTVAPTSTVGQDVKATTGFEPDHLITAAYVHGDADETYYRAYHVCLAHAVNLASTPEGGSGARVRAVAWRHNDGLATAQPTITLMDDELAVWWASNSAPISYNRGTRLDPTTPWESDGFNVETTSGANSDPGPRLFYLALNYGGKRVQLDDFVTPTSTGDEFYELGIKPDAVMGIHGSIPTGNPWESLEDIDGSPATVGGPWYADEGDEWSISLHDDDDVGTTYTATNTRNSALYLQNASPVFTTIYEASLSSFDAGAGTRGVTLNFSNAPGSARRFVMFALETEDVLGEADLVAPAAVVDGDGTLTIEGTAALSAPAGVVDAAGTLTIEGTAALVAPSALLAGAGELTIAGTAALTAPSGEVSAVGTLLIEGVAALAAPAGAVVAVGTLTVEGTAALVAPAAIVSGEGTVLGTIEGTADMVAPAGVVAGVGTLTIEGTATLVAPSGVLDADGTLTIEGVAALVAQAAVIAAAGEITIAGTAALEAPSAEVAAAGTLTIEGTAALVAPAAVVAGVGTVEVDFEGLEGCDVALSGSYDVAVSLAASWDVEAARAAEYDAEAAFSGSIC